MGWVKPLVGIFAVGAVASVALGGGDEDTVVVNLKRPGFSSYLS